MSQAQTGPRPLTGRHRARLWAPGTDLGTAPAGRGPSWHPVPTDTSALPGFLQQGRASSRANGEGAPRPPEAPPPGARRLRTPPSSQAPGRTAWGRDGRGASQLAVPEPRWGRPSGKHSERRAAGHGESSTIIATASHRPPWRVRAPQ
uniref:Uncharacterized protein n=1 Tax=Pipistrellus kuhlii TaxID=59472 RepID=A0A7J7RVH7_PIPKU|nr:hypothetical protein mPipKuh1_010236 [Pipistrellus kuhlii]